MIAYIQCNTVYKHESMMAYIILYTSMITYIILVVVVYYSSILKTFLWAISDPTSSVVKHRAFQLSVLNDLDSPQI